MGAIFGAGIDDFPLFLLISFFVYCCICCGCRIFLACCCSKRRRRRRDNRSIVSSISDLPHPTAAAVIVNHDPDIVAEAWYQENENDNNNNNNNNSKSRRLRTGGLPTHTSSYYDDENNLIAFNIYDSVEKATPIQQCIVHSSSRRQCNITRELEERFNGRRCLP